MPLLDGEGPGASSPGPSSVGPRGSSWFVVQATVTLAVLIAGLLGASSLRSGIAADIAADRGVGAVVQGASAQAATPPPVALTIPALGIGDSRLVGLRKERDGRLQVPARADQAGWYSQGPAPGGDGPAVIAGHVDDYEGPGIFLALETLKPGDVVQVRRANGSVVDFSVSRVESFAKREFPTEQVYGGGGSSLRLITCGGDYDPSSKSYLSNVVVFADPVPPVPA